MIRKVSIAGLALLLLTGCSTMIDKSSQNITIRAPGTGGALCLLERPGFREHIWTPKTIRITKSRDPMTITCVAPGNREKKFTIKPKERHDGLLNIATLGLGEAYDYETGAMFYFPKDIVVDFSDTPVTPQPLPEYQRLLADHPELAGMEEFRPGTSSLIGDDNQPKTLQPRDANEDQSNAGGLQDNETYVQGAPLPGDTDNNKPGDSTTTTTSSSTTRGAGGSSSTTTSTTTTSKPAGGGDGGNGLIHGQGGSIFGSPATATGTGAAGTAPGAPGSGTVSSTAKTFTVTSTPAPAPGTTPTAPIAPTAP